MPRKQRVESVFLVAIWLIVTSCSSTDNCVSVGRDLFKNKDLVFDLATRQGLPTTELEAAGIVGAAWAVVQVHAGQEGIPAVICLRRGDGDDTEFRILTTDGVVIGEWRSLAGLLSEP